MERRGFLAATLALVIVPFQRLRSRWQPCEQMSEAQLVDLLRAVTVRALFTVAQRDLPVRISSTTIIRIPPRKDRQEAFVVYIDRTHGIHGGWVASFTVDWRECWRSSRHFVRQIRDWTRLAWDDRQWKGLYGVCEPVTRARSV